MYQLTEFQCMKHIELFVAQVTTVYLPLIESKYSQSNNRPKLCPADITQSN